MFEVETVTPTLETQLVLTPAGSGLLPSQCAEGTVAKGMDHRFYIVKTRNAPKTRKPEKVWRVLPRQKREDKKEAKQEEKMKMTRAQTRKSSSTTTTTTKSQERKGQVKNPLLCSELGWKFRDVAGLEQLEIRQCGGAGDCLFRCVATAVVLSKPCFQAKIRPKRKKKKQEEDEEELLCEGVAKLKVSVVEEEEDEKEVDEYAKKARQWVAEALTETNMGVFLEEEVRAKQRLVEDLGFYPPELWDPEQVQASKVPPHQKLKLLRSIIVQQEQKRNRKLIKTEYMGNIRTLFLLANSSFFRTHRIGILIFRHQGVLDKRVIDGNFTPLHYLFLYHSVTKSSAKSKMIAMHWQLVVLPHQPPLVSLPLPSFVTRLLAEDTTPQQ